MGGGFEASGALKSALGRVALCLLVGLVSFGWLRLD